MSIDLSEKSKEVISSSRTEALRLSNDFISPEHMVLGMLKSDQGIVAGLNKLNGAVVSI